jgi:hypothetical protein
MKYCQPNSEVGYHAYRIGYRPFCQLGPVQTPAPAPVKPESRQNFSLSTPVSLQNFLIRDPPTDSNNSRMLFLTPGRKL